MKKVLAISPYFPPANTPDMQRLRMALPYFAENGWEVTVAAADSSCHSAPRDEGLFKTVPADTRVLALPCWSEEKCRRFGFGHLSNRIAWPWRKAVRQLLETERFDLVFFTTTQTMVLADGPHWRRVAGVPYVIDLQDPIYVPGGSYTRRNAPGGYLRYSASRLVSRFVEREAFACPSAVVATSAHYLETLKQRYPWLAEIPMETLPFGVPETDLQMVDVLAPKNNLFDRFGLEKVVFYAGRGGPDLHPSLRALFKAASELPEAGSVSASDLRFVFVGSNYGPAGTGKQQAAPIAVEYDCGWLVRDDPDRKPYFEALKATKEADCALVLGSRSADYTASKALMTLAAGKCVLAIVHKDSLVRRLFDNNPKVLMCAFEETPEEPACVARIKNGLATLLRGTGAVHGESVELSEHSARAMTRRLCRLFDSAIAAASRG